MSKSHLGEYVKDTEKAKKNGGDDDDLNKELDKRLVNIVVAGAIEAIHTATNRDKMTNNAIRVNIKRAQCVEKAFAGEVMSVVAYEDDKKNKKKYELKFCNNPPK